MVPAKMLGRQSAARPNPRPPRTGPRYPWRVKAARVAAIKKAVGVSVITERLCQTRQDRRQSRRRRSGIAAATGPNPGPRPLCKQTVPAPSPRCRIAIPHTARPRERDQWGEHQGIERRSIRGGMAVEREAVASGQRPGQWQVIVRIVEWRRPSSHHRRPRQNRQNHHRKQGKAKMACRTMEGGFPARFLRPKRESRGNVLPALYNPTVSLVRPDMIREQPMAHRPIILSLTSMHQAGLSHAARGGRAEDGELARSRDVAARGRRGRRADHPDRRRRGCRPPRSGSRT